MQHRPPCHVVASKLYSVLKAPSVNIPRTASAEREMFKAPACRMSPTAHVRESFSGSAVVMALAIRTDVLRDVAVPRLPPLVDVSARMKFVAPEGRHHVTMANTASTLVMRIVDVQIDLVCVHRSRLK